MEMKEPPVDIVREIVDIIRQIARIESDLKALKWKVVREEFEEKEPPL